MQVLDLSQNSELGDLGVARLGPLSALTSLNLSGATLVRWRLCCFFLHQLAADA